MLKLALPGGNLRKPVSGTLALAGLEIEGYAEGSRSYRLLPRDDINLTARVFREKDIPIQIALGNYDLGICGLAWVEELLARHTHPDIVKLGGLGTGRETLMVAAAPGAFPSSSGMAARWGVRIASEYPNLAETFALAARLPGYRVLHVAGSASAYPPEDAELAIVSVENEDSLPGMGLEAVQALLAGSAWVVVNQRSLRTKDLAPLLSRLSAQITETRSPRLQLPATFGLTATRRSAGDTRDRPLRLALPDGHQHPHVVGALRNAGIEIAGYTDVDSPVRRPVSPLAGMEVKLIRPQDMPQMVAAGQFDIAITGRDCILEHLYRFPDSPIEVALDLKRSPVNMCAVVSADLPAATMEEALAVWRNEGLPIVRIASEFTSIADHFARSNHFWRYQVIPTAGASEGFVPEDADLLIEGTETGKTLVENNLKSISVLFLSTTCVLVRKAAQLSAAQQDVLAQFLGQLRRAVPPEAAADATSATIQARG